MSRIRGHRELEIYQRSVAAAMEIFHLSKSFPKEERYSLTDQIRRSSRSVSANIAEAWRKRRYPAAFVAKLSDSETEAAETQCWLEFVARSGYADTGCILSLDATYDRLIASIVHMIRHKDQWTLPT